MKIKYKYIFVIFWMIVIFLLSNEVAGVSSGRSAVIVHVVSSSLHVNLSQEIMTFLVRKSAHITAYFILGVLIFNIIRDLKLKTNKTILISVTLAFLYAITDEFHQSFVPGRSCELRDVLIDTVAGIIGVSVFYILLKIRCVCINNKKDV